MAAASLTLHERARHARDHITRLKQENAELRKQLARLTAAPTPAAPHTPTVEPGVGCAAFTARAEAAERQLAGLHAEHDVLLLEREEAAAEHARTTRAAQALARTLCVYGIPVPTEAAYIVRAEVGKEAGVDAGVDAKAPTPSTVGAPEAVVKEGAPMAVNAGRQTEDRRASPAPTVAVDPASIMLRSDLLTLRDDLRRARRSLMLNDPRST